MSAPTLLELRTQARQRADMENSGFIQDSELNFYINLSIAELYDIIIGKFGDDYYVADPLTITLVNGQDTYALPSDFYKLLGIDYKYTNDRYISLQKFEFKERNYNYTYDLTFPYALRYKVIGNNLRFVPTPTSGSHTLRLWYVPLPVKLSGDTEVLQGFSGWEEYVIIDAAIKMRIKEESDVQALMAQKQLMQNRLDQAAANRDANNGGRITDSTLDVYDYEGLVRWR